MTEEERFERALEAAARDRSPRQPIAGLSTEHLRMVRFAQLLRGSRGQGPEPEFIERLHARLFRSEFSVTRRDAVLSPPGTLAGGLTADHRSVRGRSDAGHHRPVQ